MPPRAPARQGLKRVRWSGATAGPAENGNSGSRLESPWRGGIDTGDDRVRLETAEILVVARFRLAANGLPGPLLERGREVPQKS